MAKANALRDRNEKEKKQFVLEINELNRVIRHEEKLLDFMNTKNKDRLFLETEEERQSMYCLPDYIQLLNIWALLLDLVIFEKFQICTTHLLHSYYFDFLQQHEFVFVLSNLFY